MWRQLHNSAYVASRLQVTIASTPIAMGNRGFETGSACIPRAGPKILKADNFSSTILQCTFWCTLSISELNELKICFIPVNSLLQARS